MQMLYRGRVPIGENFLSRRVPIREEFLLCRVPTGQISCLISRSSYMENLYLVESMSVQSSYKGGIPVKA